MKKQASFAGLRKLAAKFGMTTALTPLADNGAESGDEEEESDEEKPTVDDEPSDEPAGDPPAGNEGGADDSDADGEDEGEDDGDDGEPAGGQPLAASAEYTRGYNAAQGRWAATLLADTCRGNLELATDLLAETNLSPKRIAAMCAAHPGGKTTALKLLDATPKVNLGGGGGVAPTAADVGKEARTKAIANANKRLGKKNANATNGRRDVPAKGV